MLIYMSSLCVFLSLGISPYNKQNIKQLREDIYVLIREWSLFIGGEGGGGGGGGG
jgi:hypothetical protein